MTLLRLFAHLHALLLAVRASIDYTVNLGSGYDPEDRGVAFTVGRLHVQADRDGLMVLDARSVVADTEDLDEPARMWVASPDTVESWLRLVADGHDVDDVMRSIELAEVGDGVPAGGD